MKRAGCPVSKTVLVALEEKNRTKNLIRLIRSPSAFSKHESIVFGHSSNDTTNNDTSSTNCASIHFPKTIETPPLLQNTCGSNARRACLPWRTRRHSTRGERRHVHADRNSLDRLDIVVGCRCIEGRGSNKPYNVKHRAKHARNAVADEWAMRVSLCSASSAYSVHVVRWAHK